MYDTTGTAKVIRPLDLNKGDKINVYFDDAKTERFVKFVVRVETVDGDKKDDGVATDGTVTYISSDFTTEDLVIIEDDEYQVAASIQKLFEDLIVKGDKIAFEATKNKTIYEVTAIDGDKEITVDNLPISGITFGGDLTIKGQMLMPRM